MMTYRRLAVLLFAITTLSTSSWGQLTNWAEIPHQQMMLDVQQQVWCQPRLACPTRPSAIEIDWVEEFVPR